MVKMVYLVFMLFVLGGPVFCVQKITDVRRSDGAYSSVRRVVNGGYMSLFQGGKFQGGRQVYRKELAIAIDRLLMRIDKKGLNLSKADLQELSQLSKTFKLSLSNTDNRVLSNRGELELLANEQRVLNHDLSRSNEALRSEISGLKDQQLYMWIGIGAAALLGALL